MSRKVAVITGAGSGIGRALAEACAARDMDLVLADIDRGCAEATASALSGVKTVVAACDVSDAGQVEALADLSFDRFGRVNVLFNNAGVAVSGRAWEIRPQDWQWEFSVNVFGVSNGISAFVPRMIASGEPGHIVNTASAAGFTSSRGMAAYCASKSAVVSLSECLQHDLRASGSALRVSVLSPGLLPTRIIDSERNRPEAYGKSLPGTEESGALMAAAMKRCDRSVEAVAEATLEAVERGDFYVFPHALVVDGLQKRVQYIVENRSPAEFADTLK